MVGADGEGVRRRPRLDLLVRAMGEDPVRETLDVSGEDWESILSGGMELDDRLLARLETMIEAMDQAVEWWDEEDDGEAVPEDVPAEALSSRSWNWGEHLEERRASLRAMHHLAMVTQYRLGVRYQGQLAMMGLVAKIELALIFMGETLLDPGVDWDGDRRLREINRRVSRLLWVKQEQDREFGGVRGVFNWLSGRTRLSSLEAWWGLPGAGLVSDSTCWKIRGGSPGADLRPTPPQGCPRDAADVMRASASDYAAF